MIETLIKDATLKGDIVSLIKKKGQPVTCFELSSIQNFHGNFTWHVGPWTNLVIWSGMSAAAIKAMADLIKEQRIIAQLSNWEMYARSGAVLGIPIYPADFDPPRSHLRSPHWLPLCFQIKEVTS
jgi:hypothetical protein